MIQKETHWKYERDVFFTKIFVGSSNLPANEI